MGLRVKLAPTTSLKFPDLFEGESRDLVVISKLCGYRAAVRLSTVYFCSLLATNFSNLASKTFRLGETDSLSTFFLISFTSLSLRLYHLSYDFPLESEDFNG